ncbi:MAG: glutathione S-transferase family protein [Alphaproteobacteria bacterium]|nr:glutathione S-transferase family protein [Alphaproteobacteria bacterium]
MILRYSLGSPFARKTAMAAHALGLAAKIEMIDHTADPSNTVRHKNPLHKIPMLIAGGGEAIFDSPVIMEYLDEIAGGGRIIPARGLPRYQTLTRLALADGVAEAAVLIHYEDRWRDEGQKSQRWIDHQASKIHRSLELFESDPPVSFDAAAMGLYCALSFLDRTAITWRNQCPRLVAWMAKVEKTEPSVTLTEPAK